jgi:hypothetical protein
MATEYVAKISLTTANHLKAIESDIDVQIDAHNDYVIHLDEAAYHLSESEYERIEWAPAFVGAPFPKKKLNH